MAAAALLPLIRARARTVQARRPPLRPMPAQQQPDLARAEYWRDLKGYVHDAHGLALAHLAPVLAELREQRVDSLRLDASPDQVRRALAAAARELVAGTTNAQLSGWARKIGTKVSDFQRQQLRRQFSAGLGIDILGAAVLKTEPYLKGQIESFTEDNVAYIRTVSSRYFGDLEEKVVEAIRRGTRADELAKLIQARTGVAESDAARIANDQTGKFFGKLNEVRQTALGVDRYTWRTMRDNRVRIEPVSHVTREGVIFLWASPPSEDAYDGHPGHPINCRCWADPDVSALLASL
jgi:SPP1 gp7 family putative phage head morphogenesis protein